MSIYRESGPMPDHRAKFAFCVDRALVQKMVLMLRTQFVFNVGRALV